ncbi:hypothetical protein [Chryseobacterium sp.]|uniref:hypothetical protein n=1 Tax=Chryseobacterium sp. TaxID=1871047 RepID=UPI002FCC9B4D
MNDIKWRFAPLSSGSIQGYTNSATETFKGAELIDNLAREICQNSLDAKLEDNEKPVYVEFRLEKAKKSDYDVFSGLEQCSRGCRKFWGNEMDSRLEKFLDGFDSVLGDEYINCLIISDYNTKGLLGSDSLNAKNTPWTALTNSDGTSYKDSSESGGSYGIGKNAPFACSPLSCVFYNTLDINGISAFKGVARIATLFNEEEKKTQAEGYYQVNNENEELWRPITEKDECSFRDFINKDNCGKRHDFGTDIIILGFNEENWEDSVVKALVCNFLVAIVEGKLVLKVENEEINAETIEKVYETIKSDPQMAKFSQIYDAYLTGEKRQISVIDENDAEFYIKTAAEFNKTIAYFRNTGMLIKTSAIRVLQTYAAIFIAKGKGLNELLRRTEPARHNQWDYKRIDKNDKETRSNAKDALSTIDKKIREILQTTCDIAKTDEEDSGLGDCLPDANDGVFEGESVGEDVLRVNQKIASIKNKELKQKNSIVNGVKSSGDKTDGDVHNHSKHPDPDIIDNKVTPTVEDSGGDQGVKLGEGMKSVPLKDIGYCRTFPISVDKGIYKLVIKAKNEHKRLFVKIGVLDENSGEALLNLNYYMLGSTKFAVKDKIGPLELKANERIDIVFNTELNERMLLQTHFEEEI